MSSAIVRPTIVDDDGSGATGTVMDAEFFVRVFDYIDAKCAEAQNAAVRGEEAATRAETAAADARRGIDLSMGR